MKRIKMWADTYSTGLFKEIGEYYAQEETSISNDTWEKLQKWVEDYDFVIPLSMEEREKHLDAIEELDRRGLKLLEKIKNEWSFDVITEEELEFEYFSEGILRTLPIGERPN